MSLSGQIALVTGASRGIGRAIAELLATQGAQVIGTATRTAGAEAITHYLTAYGSEYKKGKGIILNVADVTAIDRALTEIQSEFGTIDILVNNAGITCDNLLMRLKAEDWDQVLAVNLTAVFRICKTVVGAMIKKRHGRIINIGSVVGSTGNSGQTNYAAAKAGLVGFSKSLAGEVAKRGVTVNVVAPGFIDTDMVSVLNPEQRQAVFSRVPAGRLGDVKEVAYAVGFLASKEAAYITGETLHVNGGLHMA